MKTPRFIRPHSISICNLPAQETDYKRDPIITCLSHVKCEGPIRDTRTGQMMLPGDQIVVTIDCSDMDSDYVFWEEWDAQDVKTGWTVHPEDDYIIWNDVKYTILEHVLINPFQNAPEFIELTCQRA